MKCPICNHARVPDGALRCPNCQSALTTWLNLDAFARRAHRAGLHALTEGSGEKAAEWLLRAIVFAPEEPAYLDACGRVLGQLGRHRAAAFLLGRACELAPNPATETGDEFGATASRVS